MRFSSLSTTRSDDRVAGHPFVYRTTPITWRDGAACLESPGVDFFPFPEDVEAIARVKGICAPCPVAPDCLAYAMETRQADGVWGGLTPRERINLRRKSTEARSPVAAEVSALSG